MNKCIFKIAITLIALFMYSPIVLAECSYKERTNLLNSTKNVKINMNTATKTELIAGINPNTDLEEQFEIKVNYFQLSLSGLSDDIFAIITNVDENLEMVVNETNTNKGLFVFDIYNVSDIYKYQIDFYSKNDNCYAEKITTKTIKKPKENRMYYYSICQNEEVKNNSYCKQYIDSDFSQSEDNIIKHLNNIINEKSKDKKEETRATIISLLKNYWYIPVSIFTLVIVIGIIVTINKKRGELK